jgi:hypothetical protein
VCGFRIPLGPYAESIPLRTFDKLYDCALSSDHGFGGIGSKVEELPAPGVTIPLGTYAYGLSQTEYREVATATAI